MQFKPITAIIVLSLVVASLLVAGCTTSTTTKDTNALNMTYKAVQVPQKYGSGTYAGETPKSGYKFIGYNVTVKNVNAKDRGFAYNDWELRDTQGGVYQADGRSGMVGFNTISYIRTEPGDVVNGTLVYEVPQNAILKSLTYNDGSTEIVTNL
jgi:hypothetical protein